MTQIRWATPANDDFLGIVEWIKAQNPEAAARVGQRILDAVEDLAIHPYLGKPGRSPNTRELVVTRFPYLIAYSVEAGKGTTHHPEQVVVSRVLHGTMLWPPQERTTRDRWGLGTDADGAMACLSNCVQDEKRRMHLGRS